MSNPFGDLTAANADQMRKYMRFFRQKKEATLRVISNDFNDAIEDRYVIRYMILYIIIDIYIILYDSPNPQR